MLKVLTGCLGLLMLLTHLSGCHRLPYNSFKPQPPWVSVVKDNKRSLIRKLYKHNIQVVQYGNQTTLIVPTDQYFKFNTSGLDELEYKGLVTMVEFMRLYPHCMFAVASFSDNVDSSKANWRLTQARAETMVSFLWANGFSSKQLLAERFGEAFPVGDNHLVRGRAYNRRIEIQWPLRACAASERIQGVKTTK